MNALGELQESTLDNGLRVLGMADHRVPLVEVRLVVPFPGPMRRRAEMLARCLLTGGSPTPIRQRLAGCGGRVHVLVGPEELTIAGTVLREGFEELLSVLAEVLQRPDYRAQETALAAGSLAAAGQLGPRTRLQQTLLRQRFSNHPLTHPTTAPPETPQAVRQAHADLLVPAGSVLAIVGDLSDGDFGSLVTDLFAGWTGDSLPTTAPLGYRDSGAIAVLTEPRQRQATIMLAAQAVDSDHPRCAALDVANLVLGGYASSRLMHRLREELGLVYAIQSSFQVNAKGSWLLIETSCRMPDAAAALHEIAAVMSTMVSSPAAGAELERARRYGIGCTRLGVASQADVAGAIAGYAVYGFDPTWLLRYPDRLNKVTESDVASAAEDFLTAELTSGVILVDDASSIPPGDIGPWSLCRTTGHVD